MQQDTDSMMKHSRIKHPCLQSPITTPITTPKLSHEQWHTPGTPLLTASPTQTVSATWHSHVRGSDDQARSRHRICARLHGAPQSNALPLQMRMGEPPPLRSIHPWAWVGVSMRVPGR
jgi:hypothetical protein